LTCVDVLTRQVGERASVTVGRSDLIGQSQRELEAN